MEMQGSKFTDALHNALSEYFVSFFNNECRHLYKGN